MTTKEELQRMRSELATKWCADNQFADHKDRGTSYQDGFDACHEIMQGEIEAKDATIKELILARSCPCGDVGYFVHQVGEEEFEQEQCQFCYTETDSRFQAIANAKAKRGG